MWLREITMNPISTVQQAKSDLAVAVALNQSEETLCQLQMRLKRARAESVTRHAIARVKIALEAEPRPSAESLRRDQKLNQLLDELSRR
jgi:hypothetical protein